MLVGLDPYGQPLPPVSSSEHLLACLLGAHTLAGCASIERPFQESSPRAPAGGHWGLTIPVAIPAVEDSRCLMLLWLSGLAPGVLATLGPWWHWRPVPGLSSASLLGLQHMLPCRFPGGDCSVSACSSLPSLFPGQRGWRLYMQICFFAVLSSRGFNFLILFFQIRPKSV